MLNAPKILALRETDLGFSIDSSSFCMSGYDPLIRNNFLTCEHGLVVFVKKDLVSRKLCRFLFLFSVSFALFNF